MRASLNLSAIDKAISNLEKLLFIELSVINKRPENKTIIETKLHVNSCRNENCVGREPRLASIMDWSVCVSVCAFVCGREAMQVAQKQVLYGLRGKPDIKRHTNECRSRQCCN